VPTSQNGYTANDISLTQVWLIPGTERKLRLRKGDPGFLLVDLAAWFDKNVEDIEAGQLDDWGYAERTIRGDDTQLSNHASGTAMDLNALRHPLGAVNTFSAAQELKIQNRLKLYEGCIRWGGNYSNRKDEMHFEIVKAPADCSRVADKLRGPQQPAPNLTIATKAIAHAYAGGAFNPTDSFAADVRQFLAWGRALGYVSTWVEQTWAALIEQDRFEEAGDLFRYAFHNVARNFGHPQELNVATILEMKPYGYSIIAYDGTVL
jgi:hypothetical protein